MSKLGDWLNRVADEGEAFQQEVGNQIMSELAGKVAEEAINSASELLIGRQTGKQESQEQYIKQPSTTFTVGDAQENLVWGYGCTNGVANPFSLSAPTDHFTESEVLTQLNPGEFFAFRFQVLGVGAGGDYAHSIQILTLEGGTLESGWMMHYRPGTGELLCGGLRIDDQTIDGEYPIPSYLPNQPNQVVVIYYPGVSNIKLAINGTILDKRFNTNDFTPRMVKIRVVGMEVYFWGN